MVITRPKFISVPLKNGLDWSGGGGWRYEEKMDGVWAVEEMHYGTVIGERMKNGNFVAFDIIRFQSENLSNIPLVERLKWLDLFCETFPVLFSRPATGNGGEFLEAILSRGGEGVVAKQLDAPFGAEWFKCKRVETFDLLVTEKAQDGRPSIRIGELTGEDRGWCACRSEFDNIRVGQIVEVAAYGLTAKGKLREPRFIRIRHDKAV